MASFDLKHNIDVFTAIVCKEIVSPKLRREIAREYAEHIEDEVYHYTLGGMSEEAAFRKACENLGSPENYRDLLADIHNNDELPIEVKQEQWQRTVRRIVTAVVLTAVFVGLFILWKWFVVQVIGIVFAVYVFIHARRYAAALLKRRKAIRKLQRLANETGYSIKINRSAYSSVFRQSSVPAILMENGEKVYKIRFFTTLRMNRIIRFIGKNIYIVYNQFGYVLVNHKNVFPLSWAWIFKPKNMNTSMFSFTYDEMLEIPKYAKVLPTLEKRHDNKEKSVQEVILFNPVPMRVIYVEKTVETVIIGGEKKDGIYYHDVSGFCTMMRREAENMM